MNSVAQFENSAIAVPESDYRPVENSIKCRPESDYRPVENSTIPVLEYGYLLSNLLKRLDSDSADPDFSEPACGMVFTWNSRIPELWSASPSPDRAAERQRVKMLAARRVVREIVDALIADAVRTSGQVDQLGTIARFVLGLDFPTGYFLSRCWLPALMRDSRRGVRGPAFLELMRHWAFGCVASANYIDLAAVDPTDIDEVSAEADLADQVRLNCYHATRIRRMVDESPGALQGEVAGDFGEIVKTMEKLGFIRREEKKRVMRLFPGRRMSSVHASHCESRRADFGS